MRSKFEVVAEKSAKVADDGDVAHLVMVRLRLRLGLRLRLRLRVKQTNPD